MFKYSSVILATLIPYVAHIHVRNSLQKLWSYPSDEPIRFSYDSLLDWSEPDEGVQIFSEYITDEVSVVAVLPHLPTSDVQSRCRLARLLLF